MRLRLLCLAVLPLVLTGCLFTPGTFSSEMTIRKNGDFTFAYRGDVYLIGLTQMIEMGAALDQKEAQFVPQPCYAGEGPDMPPRIETSYSQSEEWEAMPQRPCTEADLEDQRAAWSDDQLSKKQERDRDLAVMKALLGGIDLSSPDAVADLTKRISKQKGWNRIEHLGNGRFDVDYRIAGRATQDYSFPVLERVSGTTPFVSMIIRQNGAVRVDAPGFGGVAQGLGGMSGMSGLGAIVPMIIQLASSAAMGDKAPNLDSLPKMAGDFTILTDAEILTNNTDDGPVMEKGLKRLQWSVSPRSERAPEALLQLAATDQ